MTTFYFIGDAQAATNNPIYHVYKAFFVALVVEEDGTIVDAGCSSILPLTQSFVRELLVGKNLADLDTLSAEVEYRYHGASQRSLLVALKDAHKKYLQWQQKAAALKAAK